MCKIGQLPGLASGSIVTAFTGFPLFRQQSRLGGVIMTYVWYESYEAVALETDWMKMHERIQLAESKINDRKRVLSQDHGGAWEERQAIANALNALGTLQTEVDDWQIRQSAEAERCKR